MLESPEPVNFEPLIKALTAAMKAETFSDQLAELELHLVAAELNPKPSDFCELLWGLEMLAGIDITKRRWLPVEDRLTPYFQG